MGKTFHRRILIAFNRRQIWKMITVRKFRIELGAEFLLIGYYPIGPSEFARGSEHRFIRNSWTFLYFVVAAIVDHSSSRHALGNLPRDIFDLG